MTESGMNKANGYYQRTLTTYLIHQKIKKKK